jgi:uncharacterized membrane protein
MEAIFKEIAVAIALACEVLAALVIAIGAADALIRLALGFQHLEDMRLKKRIWLGFAAWIVLALEFALAADIVRTAIAPTWDDIGKLASIAAIRTVLNWFLGRDLDEFMDMNQPRDAEPT